MHTTVFSHMRLVSVRCDANAMKEKMKDVTKTDVALNNLLVRARTGFLVGATHESPRSSLPAGM